MPKKAKNEESSENSSSDDDDEERGKFESAIDPAFCGGKKPEIVKKKPDLDVDEDPSSLNDNNDKYADQRKHLSKKLAQYLDSVIEYSDERSEESCSKKTISKKANDFLSAPKAVRLFSSSTAPLPTTEAELDRRKRNQVLETEAHNKKAKELRLKQQQKSDDDDDSSTSSSEDTTATKKKKKISSDMLACVVSADSFPSLK